MIAGCDTHHPKEQPNSNNNIFSKIDSTKNTPQPILVEKNTPDTSTCECVAINYRRNRSTDLGFQNSNYAKPKNEALFRKWSQDSLIQQVKSIRFSGFDTIPKKYAVFKHVESISVESRNGIYGLDAFPNLRSIHFFGSVIHFNTNEKWLDNLEVLSAEKTKFIGLESFQSTPNLQIIHMAYSGFDEFPKDLGSLACLHKLTLGAYMFGEIDLNQLDLSKNKCLKTATFQTWYNSLSGIPQGILTSNIQKIEVHHQQMTQPEKEAFKQIKKQLVTKSPK